MTEFALNSSTNKSMGYAPFELIYRHMPQMAITLPPTDLPGVKAFAQHVMVQPPFPFSTHLWLPLRPSASAPPLPPPLHSNSEAYLCNLCNCIAPTLGLTMDQYQTHSDLVPTPRAAIYIPFLHLSYLPDPFSLTIMGNYSFLV